MNPRVLLSTLILLLVCAGCSTPKMTSQDSVMFKSFEDFRPGPEGGVDLVWTTTGINDKESLQRELQGYDGLIMDQVWVVVDKDSDQLTDEEIQELSQHMADSIKTKLAKRFTIVDTPTEKTLRLSIALTNIETPNPVLAVTSSLLPVGIGISVISKVITGEHTNVGKARAEMLLSDAMSGEPLIAAIDKRSGNKDLGTMINSLDDAKDAISWWTDRLGITLTNWQKP